MFARTPRLTLRPGWPEDAAALTAAIAHEAVATRLARLPRPHCRAHADGWLATAARPGEHALLVFAHDRGPLPVLVGGVGLHAGDPDNDDPAPQIAYWLTPSAWGRGYATEAAGQMVDVARHALGLRRLSACHHLDNPASGRVLRKLGFREIGRGARHAAARDVGIESMLYALDPAEPVALAA